MAVRHTTVFWVLMTLTTGSLVASPPRASRYELTPESWFGVVCELCYCPDTRQVLRGTFSLVPTKESIGFRHFEVRDVELRTGSGSEPLSISGTGAYRLGGVSGRQQLLELDVRLGDQEVHLTSGLVETEAEFPRILVRVEAHLKPVCRDTVLSLSARPDSEN